jgi:chromosome segregation ATPase
MMSIPPTSFSPSRPYGRRATSPVAISATAAALSPPSLEASPSELHKKIAQLQAELEEKNKELHQAQLIIAGRDNTIREKCRIIGEEQDRLAVLEEKMRSIRQIMDSHEHIGSDSESSIGVDMELH